jgi:N-acetylmuramic acid 6-phosphate (MurNAc-6-P) etherase
MKRTTIFIDEALERDLQALARRQGAAVASLVREAIAEYVIRHQDAGSPRLSFVGAGASGRSDVAERHEELLWPTAKRTVTSRRPRASAARKRR